MKKTFKFNITLSNKVFYTFVAVIYLIIIGVLVYAYNSGLQPSVMGHTFTEIDGNRIYTTDDDAKHFWIMNGPVSDASSLECKDGGTGNVIGIDYLSKVWIGHPTYSGCQRDLQVTKDLTVQGKTKLVGSLYTNSLTALDRSTNPAIVVGPSSDETPILNKIEFYGSTDSGVIAYDSKNGFQFFDDLGDTWDVLMSISPSGNAVINAPGSLNTPTLCLAGDCRSAWPSTSNGILTPQFTKPMIQAGTASVTSGSWTTIYFPNIFGSVPIVTCNPFWDFKANQGVRTVTATNFQCYIGGTGGASQVSWMAIGQAP